MYRKNWSGTPVERLHTTAKAAAVAWVAAQTQTHLPPLCSIALSVEASHWFQATVPNAHLVVSRYLKSMEEGKRVGLAALDQVPSFHPTFGLTHLHHRGLVHACKRWPAPRALFISRSLFPSSTVKHMIFLCLEEIVHIVSSQWPTAVRFAQESWMVRNVVILSSIWRFLSSTGMTLFLGRKFSCCLWCLTALLIWLIFLH